MFLFNMFYISQVFCHFRHFILSYLSILYILIYRTIHFTKEIYQSVIIDVLMFFFSFAYRATLRGSWFQ